LSTSRSRLRATRMAHLFFSTSLAQSSLVQKSGKGSSASSASTRHDSLGSSQSTSPSFTRPIAFTPRYRITVSSTSPKYATSTFFAWTPRSFLHAAYSSCRASTAEAASATMPEETLRMVGLRPRGMERWTSTRDDRAGDAGGVHRRTPVPDIIARLAMTLGRATSCVQSQDNEKRNEPQLLWYFSCWNE